MHGKIFGSEPTDKTNFLQGASRLHIAIFFTLSMFGPLQVRSVADFLRLIHVLMPTERPWTSWSTTTKSMNSNNALEDCLGTRFRAHAQRTRPGRLLAPPVNWGAGMSFPTPGLSNPVRRARVRKERRFVEARLFRKDSSGSWSAPCLRGPSAQIPKRPRKRPFQCASIACRTAPGRTILSRSCARSRP